MTGYYAPEGGLPPQTQLMTGRALFTEAYALIPRGVQRNIVTSYLPHWQKTRAWVLARPMTGFSETFAQMIVEVFPDGGREGALAQEFSVSVERRRTSGGLYLGRLSRRVVLEERRSGKRLEVLAPPARGGEEDLLGWMAARRLVAQRSKAAVDDPARVVSGDLVRQYRMGASAGVRDPWTKVEVSGTTRVFAGSIQEFLLGRLRRIRRREPESEPTRR